MGEALACRDAIRMARQLGYQQVHLETDCLELVQLWGKRETQRSVLGSALADIDEIQHAFQVFKFTYVSRTCNRVAHVLAK